MDSVQNDGGEDAQDARRHKEENDYRVSDCEDLCRVIDIQNIETEEKTEKEEHNPRQTEEE